MIRKYVERLEREYGDLIWRHFCKIRYAKNQKEFFDAIKGIANIIDAII